MSSSAQIGGRPRPLPTLALSIGALVLGIPVAAAALIYEKVYMPNVVLGSKEIKAGPGTTKTIDFSLISGPNDAVMAGAYISIISSLVLVAGLVVVRHFSRHNVWGWALVGPGIIDVLGQIAVLAYVFIEQGKDGKQATSTDDVKYVDGKYDTNGKLYTREAWACMMDKLYHDREGAWAGKACSDMKTGRILTVPLVITSIFLLVLAFWQVQRRGGLGWLFGRAKSVARTKTDYIDMRP